MQLLVVLAKGCGLALGLLVLRGLLWLVNMLVVLPAFDPLRKIPGPDGPFFQSNIIDVSNPQASPATHENWRNKYGKTFRFHGFGKHDYRLMTFDFRAITHILTSPVYEKPWQTRTVMARLIGRGIVSMEGQEHKAQRKLMGPAFSSQSIKNLSHIFFSKAEELCDLWEKELLREHSPDTETVQPPASLDVTSGITRAIFDAMGLGGFDYAFESLKDNSRPDHQPYRDMFHVVDQGMDMRDVLDLFLPILRKLWPSEKTQALNKNYAAVQKFGRKLVELKKAKIIANDFEENDILGLLVKANLSSSVRLSDSDLLDQCSTFLFTGTDSVAIGISWALYLLSTHPTIQAHLYEELVASQKSKTWDEYDSDRSDDSGYVEEPALRATTLYKTWERSLDTLPYLDNVVREALRVCPPVHSTIRVATADDEIVCSEPVSVNGHPSNSFKIRKGSYIHVPIEGINLAIDIWGSDAREFKPERWQKLPEAASGVPGFGNILSFGYGPHSCMGHKFAVAEMKAFLATMVLRFEFNSVEGLSILKWNSFVTRPFVESIGRIKPQLPLHVVRR